MNENNDPETKTIQLVTSTDASNHLLHPAAAGFVYRRSNIEFVNENIVNPEVRPKGGDFFWGRFH